MTEIDRRDENDSEQKRRYTEWWADQAEDLGARWFRPGSRFDDDWSVPEGRRFSDIDRSLYGPAYAGGGNEPNLEGIWSNLNRHFIDQLALGGAGAAAILAVVNNTPIGDLWDRHPALAELKFLTDNHGYVSANDDVFELTEHGRKFIGMVDHLIDHVPLSLFGGLGTVLSIAVTAYETYETFKLGENLTIDEWGCLTLDFITDSGESLVDQGLETFDAFSAVVESIGLIISNPTNEGVFENEDGYYFDKPNGAVANSPDGARIDVTNSSTESSVEITLPREPEFYPETPPELPNISPARELIERLHPDTDTPIEFPNFSINLDMLSGADGLPTLRLRTRLEHAGDRTHNGAERNRLRKDRKEFGARAYVSALHWVNNSFGRVTEVLDLYNILKWHVYVERNKLLPLWLTEGAPQGQSRSGFRKDWIPLAYVPVGDLPATFNGIMDGDVNFSLYDVEGMMMSVLIEQATDLAIALGSKTERAAIEKTFGKGRGQGPLQYGNFSTWANRFNKLLEAAEEGEYEQCKQE